MSRKHEARRRSASPVPDEDADYQLALRLSEELNGGQLPLTSAGPSQQPDYDADADFAYALELQFGNSEEAHPGASASNSHSTWTPAAPHSEVPPWVLKENEPKIANYHAETSGGKAFTTLAGFIQHVRSAHCPTCGQAFFQSELNVRTMLENWKSGKTALTSCLKCTNCSNSSCIACTPQAFARSSVISIQGKQVSWCCTGGRLLMLFVLLCGFDEQFSATKMKEVSNNRPRKQPPQPEPDNKKKSSKRGRGGGVGFGGSSRHPMSAMAQMPSGMGYGSDVAEYNSWGPGYTLSGHRFDASSSNVDSKAKALSVQSAEDQSNGLVLELVEGLLPSFERESSFDFDPPEVLVELLVGSKISNYCAELLRNDSLEDATKRKGVYQALVSFIRTLGAHYATATRMLYDERPWRDDKTNLLTLFFHAHPGASKEKTSSLFKCLTNLTTQSELVLQGAKSNENEFRTYDGQNLLLLCRQISDLQQYLLANSGTLGTVNSTQGEAEVLALIDLPDDQVLKTHKFASSANLLRSPPPGRFKRLITEITTLKTGLPPGIFVRYAESRPDVQKVVIIGPVGTPYENGIFEFDIYCDANFPNNPPQVQFKTTGGGKVGFNPNLYADGKVCLSLLGTWQGEPWMPGESTLLQVVISIQAMILCEEPWYNEPGRELSYQRGSDQGPSASYNQTIRQHTVRTAILDWLENTPPLWKDVVDQHFKTNANKILQTAVEWSKSKVLVGPYASFNDFDDYDSFAELMNTPQAPGGILGPPPMTGSRLSTPKQKDLSSMLPQLQMALEKYGVTKIVLHKPEPVTEQAPKVRRSWKQPTTSQPASSQPPPYTPIPPLAPLPSMPYTVHPPTTATPGHHGFGGFGGFGGYGIFGNFMGRGKVLRSGSSDQPGAGASNAAAGERAGSVLGRLDAARGRYETCASTRGRGGPSQATPSVASTPPGYVPGSLFGGPLPLGQGGRGGFSQDRGRGGRGGFQ